jgi:hypothetical protein
VGRLATLVLGWTALWLGWVGLCKRAALKCWAGTRVARVLRLALGLICDCFDGWVGLHSAPASGPAQH